MFGFDPLTIGVGALVWFAFKKKSGTDFGALTPEREEVYRNAMAHCADGAKLVQLAQAFQQEGLRAEAAMLRRRAEWRGRTEVVRKKHAEVYDKAMASENVPAILAVATAFEDMTATYKASQLRERAQALNEAGLRKTAEAEVEPRTPEAEPAARAEPKKTNGVAADTTVS